MKRKNSVKGICISALIAASYFVLTYISAMLGMSSGVLQLRLSEALCVLPAFTPYAISGLCIGCLLSNMLTGGMVLDIVFGTLATLVGAVGTYFTGKYGSFAAVLPPVIANTLIIPPMLAYASGTVSYVWVFMICIGICECITAGGMGMILYRMIAPIKHILK